MENQKYGIITDGQLEVSDTATAECKPLIFDKVPEFDQLTEYVVQSDAVDEGGRIKLGVEVRTVDSGVIGKEDFIDMGVVVTEVRVGDLAADLQGLAEQGQME